MTDSPSRLSAVLRRVDETERIRPLPSAVHVLVAPPLGRLRVWAGFHLPSAWLRALGWQSDYLACQRRESVYRRYEQENGRRARSACHALTGTGARVTPNARRRDLEAKLYDPDVEAIILVGHHAGDGVELADGIMPGGALMPLLEARGARRAFSFVWVVCSSSEWGRDARSIAPEILAYCAAREMPLALGLENVIDWIAELDGHTAFDVARQRALGRMWPSDKSGVTP